MKILILLGFLTCVSSFYRYAPPASVSLYRNYPLSRKYHNDYLKRISNPIQNRSDITRDPFSDLISQILRNSGDSFEIYLPDGFPDPSEEDEFPDLDDSSQFPPGFLPDFSQGLPYEPSYKSSQNRRNLFERSTAPAKIKSEHFEIVNHHDTNFQTIGGYSSIKKELAQCLDILKNYTKYQKFNVRIPRGIVFEGPPGNGKTMIAKAFAGEANMSFIAVSGAEFQEKYVGIGSARIRELFKLASDNSPCIIFIDEIDALGRKRSSDGETSSSERDSTLNELLVAMDGFKSNAGVFVIASTNRVDLLDSALMRPGRIDKKIYIGYPDSNTREAIIDIHISGKPNSISCSQLVEMSNGMSGAQIENLLNEAMLLALRDDRESFTQSDIENVYNKIVAGWQPDEHEFSRELLEKICVHELGHAIVGMTCKNHAKMNKIVINLSSPKNPGYTLFEEHDDINTKESLFEHLMILLAGRIAEEIIYGSYTTGAINDFEEALKLANKMVVYYGMGQNVIYPQLSEKYKELIDNDIFDLITQAYTISGNILKKHRHVIRVLAKTLLEERILLAKDLQNHLIL